MIANQFNATGSFAVEHIRSAICQASQHQRKNPFEYNDTVSDFVLKYSIEEEEVSGQQQ